MLSAVQIEGEWRTEIVREPAVIRAYVKRKQEIEEEMTLADSLAPTGDADRDKRAKKRSVVSRAAVRLRDAHEYFRARLEEEIARMKKNQERRLHRKNAKIAKEGGQLMTLSRPMKPDTTVCRNCVLSQLAGFLVHTPLFGRCYPQSPFAMGSLPTGLSPFSLLSLMFPLAELYADRLPSGAVAIVVRWAI
jgi:hypothetical protein